MQRHHDVEDGTLLVERNHDAADALDQQNLAAVLDRRFAESHNVVHVDAPAFAASSEVRRDRGAKPPR